MSYHTWSVDGFGICVTDIDMKMRSNNILDNNTECLSRINQVINFAPKLKADFDIWCQELIEAGTPLTYDTVCENWEDDFGYYGLTSILTKAISEYANIEFVECDDFDGYEYILFCPSYPWCKVTDEERNATQESLTEVFNKFAKIMCDEEVNVDYQSVENGG